MHDYISGIKQLWLHQASPVGCAIARQEVTATSLLGYMCISGQICSAVFLK